MVLNIDAKFVGKLNCAFKNDEEFREFSPQHVRKSKNQDFDGILLSKVKKV